MDEHLHRCAFGDAMMQWLSLLTPTHTSASVEHVHGSCVHGGETPNLNPIHAIGCLSLEQESKDYGTLWIHNEHRAILDPSRLHCPHKGRLFPNQELSAFFSLGTFELWNRYLFVATIKMSFAEQNFSHCPPHWRTLREQLISNIQYFRCE